MYALLDGEYTRIAHDTTSTISFYMDGSEQKSFSISIGNIVPQSPDNLTSTPDKASISLDWDADGTDLSDISNWFMSNSEHLSLLESVNYNLIDFVNRLNSLKK